MRDRIPEDEVKAEYLAALQRAAGNAPPAWDSRNAWQKMTSTLATRGPARRLSKQYSAYWAMATMAMVAAIVLGVVVQRYVSPTAALEYVTAPGQRLNITLTDGTRVVLAPESRLRIPEGYGHGARQTTLDGEGYFAVVHDTRHPFAVLTHNINITDVGTEFDVRDDDDDVRVAVAKGFVVVGAGRGNGAIGYSERSIGVGTVSRTRPTPPSNTPPSFQDIPLSAGDLIDVTNGVPTVTHHADIAAATAWRQGGLVFDEQPLTEVAHTLSRTFGVTITIADSTVATRRVTASFSNQPLDLVLDEITRVVGARYEHSSHGIVIRAGLSANHSPSQDSGPRPLTTARAED